MFARTVRCAAGVGLLLAIAADECRAAHPRLGWYSPPQYASGYGYTAPVRIPSVQSVQAEIASARQRLGQAESRVLAGNSTINAANLRISQAREEVDTARQDIRDGRAELRIIEQDVIAAADENSPLHRAASEVELARANLQRAQARVLKSPEYRARVADLVSSRKGACRLSELRSDALRRDGRYQQALFDWEMAREQFSGLRDKHVYEDFQWKKTSVSLRDAKLSQNRAVVQASAGGLQKLPAGAQVRHAQAAANESRQIIAAGEAWLSRAGVRQPTSSPGERE